MKIIILKATGVNEIFVPKRFDPNLMAGEVSRNRNTEFSSVIYMAQKLEKFGLVYHDDKAHYLVAEEASYV
jgi:hypothetical protein